VGVSYDYPSFRIYKREKTHALLRLANVSPVLNTVHSANFGCSAASFSGTKRFPRNASLFAGIPMIFSVILGNQSKMELWYQEKKFVAGRMSGNEQLGNNRRETRGACKWITVAKGVYQKSGQNVVHVFVKRRFDGLDGNV